jgi:hypothetical protein
MEKLQLQDDFPTNLLIKTYDALCESCRSIAPLQLLFLEIFEYIDTLWSFVISKTGSRNWNGQRCRRRRARARMRTSVFTLPRIVSVRNVVPTLTSSKRRGLSLNGRC